MVPGIHESAVAQISDEERPVGFSKVRCVFDRPPVGAAHRPNMELNAARTLAHTLMAEHGITASGWTFDFDSARRRLGVCKHNTKSITISRFMVGAADEETVRQTMLHEIAHALVGASVRNPRTGKRDVHGSEWKRVAASIGYTGKRTAENPFVTATRPTTAGFTPRNVSRPSLVVGTPVRMSNGYEGVIVKVNSTRYKVWVSAELCYDAPFGFVTQIGEPGSVEVPGLGGELRLNVGQTFTIPAGSMRGRQGRVLDRGQAKYKIEVVGTPHILRWPHLSLEQLLVTA